MPRQKEYQIFVNVRPRPKPHEISAAKHVSMFLGTNIEFVQTGSAKTPDLLIANQLWEMKSPTGSGSRTILHQFQRAEKQAKFMIFDARRIKMDQVKCLNQVRYEFKKSKTIKRVIFISKDGAVFEL